MRRIRIRMREAERLSKKIQEDYIKMALKNLDKGYMIKSLQEKYKRVDGKLLSRQRVYNALNFREINKRIQATQECDLLLDA